jgi:hypothetical protein
LEFVAIVAVVVIVAAFSLLLNKDCRLSMMMIEDLIITQSDT